MMQPTINLIEKIDRNIKNIEEIELCISEIKKDKNS
jgi:hypothetical protein